MNNIESEESVQSPSGPP